MENQKISTTSYIHFVCDDLWRPKQLNMEAKLMNGFPNPESPSSCYTAWAACQIPASIFAKVL